MKRHFIEHRDFDIFVATSADFRETGISSLIVRRPHWLQRLLNSRFVPLIRNFELLFHGVKLDGNILKPKSFAQT